MSHPNHIAYARFAIAMHWSIAILILLNLSISFRVRPNAAILARWSGEPK
ncbi:hypothetical protein G3N64_24235 [Burkholderia sp. Ac-20344]|nr:hypothetical protein [Burkholderia sp. Ac-20344]